jgi:hypothetical protein
MVPCPEPKFSSRMTPRSLLRRMNGIGMPLTTEETSRGCSNQHTLMVWYWVTSNSWTTIASEWSSSPTGTVLSPTLSSCPEPSLPPSACSQYPCLPTPPFLSSANIPRLSLPRPMLHAHLWEAPPSPLSTTCLSQHTSGLRMASPLQPPAPSLDFKLATTRPPSLSGIALPPAPSPLVSLEFP